MIETAHTLDAKGLACPMPIVRTRKAMNELETGEILEVLATDKGSTADIKAWASGSGHAYLGTETEGDVLHHFLKKDSVNAVIKEETPVINYESFIEKLKENPSMSIVDVREVEEYEAVHVPGAINIPLGDIDARKAELDKNAPIYLICQTGRRSGIAGIELKENGFNEVYNVVPGMTEWNQTQNIQKKGN